MQTHHYGYYTHRNPFREGYRDAATSPVSIILNVLWLVLGGAAAALGWFVAAAIMALTIIGLPWARAAFDNAVYHLWPFGVRPVDRDYVHGPQARPGFFAFVGNLIWFVLAGWWLALGHLAAALVLGITIIGLPFAWAHLKLAGYAVWPLGRRLVDAGSGEPFGRPGGYRGRY